MIEKLPGRQLFLFVYHPVTYRAGRRAYNPNHLPLFWQEAVVMKGPSPLTKASKLIV
jgi:hypothetical protein